MRWILLLLLSLLVIPAEAQAGRRHCRLFGWRSCRPCYQPAPHHYDKTPYQKHTPHQKGAYQKGGDVQAAAQWRANTLAARGYGGHFALPCYGASGEGWGWGATPQAALASCCVTASGRVAAQAVAPSGSGYFAIKLYW